MQNCCSRLFGLRWLCVIDNSPTHTVCHQRFTKFFSFTIVVSNYFIPQLLEGKLRHWRSKDKVKNSLDQTFAKKYDTSQLTYTLPLPSLSKFSKFFRLTLVVLGHFIPSLLEGTSKERLWTLTAKKNLKSRSQIVPTHSFHHQRFRKFSVVP